MKARNRSSRVALAAVCRLWPLLPDAHVVRFELDKVAQKCPTACAVFFVFQWYLLQPPQLLKYLRRSLFSKAKYFVTTIGCLGKSKLVVAVSGVGRQTGWMYVLKVTCLS